MKFKYAVVNKVVTLKNLFSIYHSLCKPIDLHEPLLLFLKIYSRVRNSRGVNNFHFRKFNADFLNLKI